MSARGLLLASVDTVCTSTSVLSLTVGCCGDETNIAETHDVVVWFVRARGQSVKSTAETGKSGSQKKEKPAWNNKVGKGPCWKYIEHSEKQLTLA